MAAVTVACVPLKVTVLSAIVLLKLAPVMVTVVPIGPFVGVKLVTEGAAICSSSLLQAEIINTLARIRMAPANATLGSRFLFSDFIKEIFSLSCGKERVITRKMIGRKRICD